MRFENKVVLVTGGSKGIGKAIVQAFAKEGAAVVFTYKSGKEDAIKLQEELAGSGLKSEACAMDVTDVENVKNTIESIDKKYGSIDILINNAGIIEDCFLMLMSEKSWDDVIDTNLKGIYSNCKAVVPTMIRQRRGVIVNMASVAGMKGVMGQTNYCASKAGIIGFTRALSAELAGKNIRVNAIAPGYIDTDMLTKTPKQIIDNIKTIIPCKRVGKVDEVAKVALFLASDDASYIFGQTIIVDGGLLG